MCGFIALPFGGFYTVQGIVAFVAAGLLLVMEKPMAPNFFKQARKHPMKRAFLYMLFVLHT